MKQGILRRTFIASSAAAVAMPAILRNGHAQSLNTVVLAMPNAGLLNTPLFTATAMGMFKKHGIEPKYEYFKGGVAATAALVGGSAHITPESASSTIKAKLNGAGVQVVGGLVTQYAANVVAKPELLNGRNPKDIPVVERIKLLKGRKLAVTGAGSGTHQMAVFLCKKAGLNPDTDLTISFLGTGDAMVAALQQGSIDAAIVASPSLERAQQTSGAVLLVVPQIGEIEEINPFLYVSLNAASKWLEGNQEVGTRFMKAVAEAMAYLKSGNTDEGRDLVQKAFFPKLDEDLYRRAWDFMNHAFARTPKITNDDVAKVLWFVEVAANEKLDVKPSAVYNDVLVRSL